MRNTGQNVREYCLQKNYDKWDLSPVEETSPRKETSPLVETIPSPIVETAPSPVEETYIKERKSIHSSYSLKKERKSV